MWCQSYAKCVSLVIGQFFDESVDVALRQASAKIDPGQIALLTYGLPYPFFYRSGDIVFGLDSTKIRSMEPCPLELGVGKPRTRHLGTRQIRSVHVCIFKNRSVQYGPS